MKSYFSKIIESKEAHRKSQAKLSYAEKFAIVENMRERNQAIIRTRKKILARATQQKSEP
jgi:predicted type IV restriction endonuclease